jgi:cell division protein FtsL
MEKQNIKCPNCEKEFAEGFEFCPHCGQKAKEELTLGVLFYNTIANYFSFDARFLKSFIPLMFKPGYLAKKFLEGKRLLFLHPAQMYLFISVIFFFLYSFNVRDAVQEINQNIQKQNLRNEQLKDSLKSQEPVVDSVKLEKLIAPLKEGPMLTGMSDEDVKKVDSIVKANNKKEFSNNFLNFDFNENKIDSLIAIDAPNEVIYKAMGMGDDAGFLTHKFYAQMLKFYKDRGIGSILQTFYDSIPLAMFFLLPIFAFILKIFYFRRGRFSHHLVFSFYFFSFLFTVFSILTLANLIWDTFPSWITTLIILSTYFYFFLAVKRFYGQGWFLSFFKTGLVTFTFFTFVIPLAVVIMGLMAFLFY